MTAGNRRRMLTMERKLINTKNWTIASILDSFHYCPTLSPSLELEPVHQVLLTSQCSYNKLSSPKMLTIGSCRVEPIIKFRVYDRCVQNPNLGENPQVHICSTTNSLVNFRATTSM